MTKERVGNLSISTVIILGYSYYKIYIISQILFIINYSAPSEIKEFKSNEKLSNGYDIFLYHY